MIYREGLGDSPLDISIPQIGSTVIGAGAPIGIAAMMGTSLAVPVIGAAIAGVTLLVGAWLGNIAKHNMEKTQATAIVNQAEPYLKQNLAAFQSIAQPNKAEQDQALANFDAIWSQVVNACGSSSLEDAGKRCINDRSAGGQWNWFAYYRDPIANAQTVEPSITSSSQIVSSIEAINPLYLGLAGIGLVILLFSGRGK